MKTSSSTPRSKSKLQASNQARAAAPQKPYALTRRSFLYSSLLAGVAPAVFAAAGGRFVSPNSKLNIASIGAGGRALQVLGGLESENIMALADVDWARAAGGFQRFPNATRYKDFRQMLDRERSIDAVLIATPDHMHAPAALAAMQLGKHVYVEKPLTRTPWEARLLTEAAAKYRVATQMGNQGYSHEATRVASEIIWSGEIGDVTEVHAFRAAAGWPNGATMQEVPASTPVPDTLDWDLWLGPAAARPFTSGGAAYEGQQNGFYLPFNWRGFFDFGTDLIGDWGIHILGPANWALQLGAPLSVECVKQEGQSPFTYPDRMHIRWGFGARGSMPPVAINWYVNYPGPSGPDAYTPTGMTIDQVRQLPGTGPALGGAARGGGGGARAGGTAGAPAAAAEAGAAAAGAARGGGGRGGGGAGGGQQGSGYNQIFVGTKGFLGTSGRGEGVGLIPGSRWAEYTLPSQLMSRSPGHQRDWIRACKGGTACCSDFSVSGPYTEWVVLGAAAIRVPGKLLWDSQRFEFTNSPEANQYLKPHMRPGWEMKA